MSASIKETAESFRSLADSIALKLAQDSIINVELREALHTVRLGEGAVRIGDWDILSVEKNDGRYFDIRSKKNGEIVVDGLVFYETARMIVTKLNEGVLASCYPISRLRTYNEDYVRLRADLYHYESRLEHYLATNDQNRAMLMDNRLSAAQGRIGVLQDRLLKRAVYL
jgi:hypothetical protein